MKSKMVKCKQCENYIVVSGVECEEVRGYFKEIRIKRNCSSRFTWTEEELFLKYSLCHMFFPVTYLVWAGFAQEMYGSVSA